MYFNSKILFFFSTFLFYTEAFCVCQVDHFEINTGFEPCPQYGGLRRTLTFAVAPELNPAVFAYEVDEIEVSSGTGNLTTHYCNSTHVTELGCQEGCLTHTDPFTTCNGDASYCALSTSTCDPNGDCNCFSVNYERRLFIPSAILNADIAVTLVDIVMGVRFANNVPSERFLLSITDDDPNVFLNLNEDIFTVRLIVPETLHVHIQKGPFSDYFLVSNATTARIIPQSVFDSTGTLYVDVYRGNNIVKRENFEVVATFRCTMVDCFFCSQAFENFSCMSTGMRTMFVIIMCLIGMAALILCPSVFKLAFYSLLYAFKFIWFMMKSTMGFTQSRFIKDMKEKGSNYAQRSQEYFTTPVVSQELPTVRTTDNSFSANLLRKNKNILFLATIILLFGVTQAQTHCDDGLQIPARTESCMVLNTTHESCSFRYDVTVTLPFVGSNFCYLIRNLNGDNEVVAHGNVGYLYNELESNIDIDYYTSHWIGAQASRHRCRGAGPCEHDNCENINPNDTLALNQLSAGEQSMWPGFTTCRRSCGCISCGCFSCSASCVFSRFGIVPDGPVYTVGRPGITHRRIGLSMDLMTHGHVHAQTTFDIASSFRDITSNGHTFRIHYQGALAGDPVHTNGRKVIYSGNTAFFALAAEPNDPRHSIIGDIQAHTSQSLTVPNTNAFIFDPVMVTPQFSDKSTSYTFRTSGINQLSASDRLPGLFDGNRWAMNGGLLVSNLTNPGPVIIQLTNGQNPITYVRERRRVCPTGTNQMFNISGCFDCPTGFEGFVRLRSSCQPGDAFLRVPENMDHIAFIRPLTQVLALTTDFQDFRVRMYATVQNLGGRIIRIGMGTDTFDITMDATLSAFSGENRNDTFRQPNITITSPDGHDVTHHSFGSFLGGWLDALDRTFTGAGSTIQHIISAFTVIGIAIITIMSIPLFLFTVKGVMAYSSIIKKALPSNLLSKMKTS